ncbi:acyl carrier protein [Streptomyces ipomoeae]|uniref:acyl carrier protein n=1 Tax=Streptomyces ipomoeae TaxID=103232 RepID=UPI001FD4E4C1|nr:acyl carrier protein [Streptomyces ipomoeae]MDX2937677.1 acyl carrier protein [Streptomyces ipomoeae]
MNVSPIISSSDGLSEAGRARVLLDLVRQAVAEVLGFTGPDGVDADQPFLNLGMDSLSAVDLRDRLDRATGLRLPSTLVFDYPTPVEVARYLRDQLDSDPDGSSADPQEAAVRRILTSVPLEKLRRAGLLEPLLQLAEMDAEEPGPPPENGSGDIAEMDAEDLIDLVLGNNGP